MIKIEFLIRNRSQNCVKKQTQNTTSKITLTCLNFDQKWSQNEVQNRHLVGILLAPGPQDGPMGAQGSQKERNGALGVPFGVQNVSLGSPWGDPGAAKCGPWGL